MGMTGQSTFGYGKTDLAVIDSFYDRAGKDENGIANASKASFVNSAEGQQMLETITLVEMGRQEVQTSRVDTLSDEALLGATVRVGTSDVPQETAKVTGRTGPFSMQTLKDFGKLLTPDDSKDPLAPVDVVPYDPETRGGNEPLPVTPPTAPDQEELAAQAGGAVAQSVIDDDAGVSDAAGADAGSFGGEGGGYSGDEGGLW